MMLTRITYIFGFNLPRNSFSFIVSSIIGQIASICIGGGDAVTITIRLGEAFILLMEKLYNGEISFDEFKTMERKQRIQSFLKTNV